MITVDVDVVDCILVGFIEALVGDFAMGMQWIAHGVWDSAYDNSCF